MSKYKFILYDEIDDYLYVFKYIGKSMKRLQNLPRPRSEIILWDKLLTNQNFFGTSITVLDFIYNNWDSLCERGVSRPMLDFELCIDTDNSSPVCCRKLAYGSHESKIMTKKITDLEISGLITDCEEVWDFTSNYRKTSLRKL